MLYQHHPDFPELLIRIFSDWIPDPLKADIAYPFTETIDNQTCNLEAALYLLEIGAVGGLSLLKASPEQEKACGCAGLKWCEEHLERNPERNLERREVHNIPFPLNEGLNSRTEINAVRVYASTVGWEKLIVTAPPFHLLRCFITAVSSLYAKGEAKEIPLDYDPALHVWSFLAQPQDWSVPVIHSQGKLNVPFRYELIKTELERINTYYANGQLLDPRQILNYMNRRDALFVA